MASTTMTFEMRLVPSERTIGACIALLNAWQEVNPGMMIALMPNDKYEIVKISEKED